MMSTAPRTIPVRDSVPRINNEIAVGEDLGFQRRWWKFEKGVWIFFTIVVILDFLGAFGRGLLANAHMQTSDGSMRVKYERIERFSTPSVLTIHFGDTAVHNGKIQLWVSDSMVRELGNQRIAPQPETSALAIGGILYTFPSSQKTNSVAFALQPSSPGIFRLALRVEGSQELNARVVVMP